MIATALLTLPADQPTDAHVLALYRRAMERSRELDGYQDWPVDTEADCDRKRAAAEQAVEVAHYLNELMDSWPEQYNLAVEIYDLQVWLDRPGLPASVSSPDAAMAWVLLGFDTDDVAEWLDATDNQATPALAAALKGQGINPYDDRLQQDHPLFTNQTWLDALVAGLDVVAGMLGA